MFLKWFDLYFHLCNIYSIEKNDTYNMNKKSNALGYTLYVKIISNAKNKSSFCPIITN